MKYDLTYDQEWDLIIGRVEGTFDLALVKAMASEHADLIASSGCHKLLNDLRNAHLTASVFDIYKMPRMLAAQGVPITCRSAFLVADLSQDFLFLETVSFNCGQCVRIFNDLKAALEWLGTNPDEGAFALSRAIIYRT